MERRMGWWIGGMDGGTEKVRVYGERFPVWYRDAGLIRSLEQIGFWKRYVVVLFSIGPSVTKPIVWSHSKQSNAKGRVSWCIWENILKRRHLNTDKNKYKQHPQKYTVVEQRHQSVWNNGDHPAADSLPCGVMLIQGLCVSGNKKTYQVGKDISGLYFETSFAVWKGIWTKNRYSVNTFKIYT